MTSSLALRVAARSMAHRVAARYKSKKKVKTQDGEEMTVYEYSDKQVANRNKKKAERIEKLRKSIDKIRTKVKKDLKSSDKATAMTALVVGLIDDTFERVGNEGSAKDGHYGVTGWKKKHVTFGSGGATIKYVGKSGVKHEKKVSDAGIRKALKKAYDECAGDNKGLFEWDGGSVTAEKVNEYLKPFDITAKDLRGFHANREMTEHLKAIRAKGKDLPEEKKDREKLLKKEFLKALDETAEAVGHEAATLRSMYLVPGLEDQYMKDGTVSDKLSSQRVAERYLVARSTQQAEKLKALLEAVKEPLLRAEHGSSAWSFVRTKMSDEEKEALARSLARASQEVIDYLKVSFDNERLQDRAKHYLTRIKNLTKMLVEYVKAPSWAQLEEVLKKQGTKSKSAYDKFIEYSKEAHSFVDYFDTEHEDTINVGPWTVAMFTAKNADWDGDKVAKLKHILEQTSKILSSMGVGSAAGGKVYAYPTEILPGASGSHDAYASYSFPTDRLSLSVVGELGHVLHRAVHESGHRVYFKLMSGNARKEWESFFESESGPPDVETIIQAWEAYANKKGSWEAEKYGRYTPYFAQELKKSDPDMYMWLSMIAKKLPHTEDFDKYTGSPKKGSKPGLDVLIEHRSEIKTFLHPVTAYSGTNAEELFAETFAALALEGASRVPEIVREMFRKVLPQARIAAAEIGEKVFGRFKVRYLKQHEGVVDKLGSQLLEAEKAYESAGVPIVHEIQVALTGTGAAHALGLYTMGSVPPTIQIAPKSYADPKLIHTLIHELGHYFHDKVVPGGIQNPAIISKHMWAVRQKSTGHGNQVDVLNRKLKSLNNLYFKLNEERSLKKPLPRKGQVFEYDPWINGKQYHVKGRIVGKRDSRTVNVEIIEAPPEYMERQRIYRRGPGPLVVPEAVAVLTFTGVNEAAVAELEKVEKERHEVHEQLKALISEGKGNDDRYEVHLHDWVPTNYSRKDHFEYFAEMLTTFVLGHLKPEPTEWLKSVLKTGAAPSQEVPE